jgi:hypothetical protein
MAQSAWMTLAIASAFAAAWAFRTAMQHAVLRWATFGAKVTYYRDTNLLSSACSRLERDLSLDYGGGRPALSVPADHWSARWEANLDVPATEKYTFEARSDDGVRLWIDGTLVLDRWRVQKRERSLARKELLLDEGLHRIRIEHFDHEGPASLDLRWSGGPIRKPLIVSAPFLLNPAGREKPHRKRALPAGGETEAAQ